MNHETKLKRFEEAVFDEIESKTAQATADSKEEFERKLKESTDRQLQISYNDIQSKAVNIKKQTKRELARIGLDNKRTLINKRNELVDSIFDSVETKVNDFLKTQEYQDYLLDEVESFSKKYKLSDIEIHIGNIDFDKELYIKKAYRLPCTIIVDKNITMGGFAIKDEVNCSYYDYTMNNKINEQRAVFVQNSPFAL